MDGRWHIELLGGLRAKRGEGRSRSSRGSKLALSSPIWLTTPSEPIGARNSLPLRCKPRTTARRPPAPPRSGERDGPRDIGASLDQSYRRWVFRLIPAGSREPK